MRLYVWHPSSLTDYYDGMVCAIAATKREAIELAVDEVHPKFKRHQLHKDAKVREVNARIDEYRDTFRKELRKLKPTRIMKRGAIHIRGGG